MVIFERYEFVRTADGSATARHPAHGEHCHSLAGARTQARERYADAVLAGRAWPSGVVRLLDIGTGLGFNLAAALECVRRSPSPLRLRALSLELDPRVLGAALAVPPDPDPSFAAVQRCVQDALARALAALRGESTGTWIGAVAPDCELELRLGDARESLCTDQRDGAPRTESFDAVFLDPYSPGVEAELWEQPFIDQVARRMARGALLATYSAATRVRVALLRAGLAVGPAPRVGTKAEGTLAARDAELPRFAPRVERRLRRRAELPGAPPQRIPSEP